ncbi:MAG: hypothetical protein ACKVPY_12270 [Paracoccaceae bacterium]
MKSAKSLALMVGIAAFALSPFAVDLPFAGSGPAFAKGNGGGNGGGGNGNGNAGGNGNGNAGGAKSASAASSGSGTAGAKNHGAIASELKGLNAYHASAQAFANASPNSQVGRIAAYREAAVATQEAQAAADEAQSALDTANGALTDLNSQLSDLVAGYTGRTSAEVQGDIGALDPAAPDYADQLAALTAEQDAATSFEAAKTGLETQIADAAADAAGAQAAYDTAAAEAEAAAQVEDAALTTASNGRTISDEALAYLREQLGL